MLQIQKLVDLACHLYEKVTQEEENKFIVLKLHLSLQSPIWNSFFLELCINSTFYLVN